MALGSEQELLTVADAARDLKVSTATIWRWINSGRLQSIRVGPKSIRLRNEDIEKLLQPARTLLGDEEGFPIYRTLDIPPLTAEQRQRARQALRDIDRIKARIRAANGGKIAPDSVEIIHQMRDERDEQLAGR